MGFATIGNALSAGRSGLDKRTESVVEGLRAAANETYSRRVSVDTQNTGVLTDAWLSDALRPQSDWLVVAEVFGANAARTAWAHYQLVARFGRPGMGAAVQMGTTQIVFQAESNAAFDARLDLSGGAVRVRVNDGAQGIITWTVHVDMRGISGP